MPTTNSTPAAPRLEVIDSIGPWNVLAAVDGPSCPIVSVSTRVTRSGSAKSPITDTMTINAGKIDSTA